VKPESEIPYRFAKITFWRAADIIPVQLVPAPKQTDDDETADD
jgi:hypothetical protein